MWWVTSDAERRVLVAARHDVVMTGAVWLPVNAVLTAVAVVMALAGGPAEVPAPVWWVLVGVLGWDTLRSLVDLVDQAVRLWSLRSCPECLTAAVELDAADERWAACVRDLHARRPASTEDGDR